MKKNILLFSFLLIPLFCSLAQVGIGTTNVSPSSILHLESNNQALLLTRVANTNAILVPVNGMIVYDMSCNCFKGYSNGVWSGCGFTGAVASLDCSSITNAGTLIDGVPVSNVHSTIPYAGGNGSSYVEQLVNSTGVTGLTATVQGGDFSYGSGTLHFTITGTPNGTGNANFLIEIGGQTCTLTRTVLPGSISSISCSPASNSGVLKSGLTASNVFSTISYTGGNGGNHYGNIITSTGVTGLTATLNSGVFNNGSGNLTYAITGAPNTYGLASFNIEIGGQNCTLNLTVLEGTITNLNCLSATTTGTIEQNTSASGISFSIPYSGGTGGNFSQRTTISSGVTGLTGILSAGTFANGSGTLTYNLSGTPSSFGNAVFNLSIGGQTCTVTFNVQQSCGAWAFVSETSNQPSGNSKVWKKFMCHNLGADTSKNPLVYHADLLGDLYQWGRPNDGHQLRSSTSTATLATNPNATAPAAVVGTFINSSSDWLSGGGYPDRWGNGQDILNPPKSSNDPCPTGFKIPSVKEWGSILRGGKTNGLPSTTTANVWTWTGNGYTVGNSLFLPAAGYRDMVTSPPIVNSGIEGYYWSSTINGADAYDLSFNYNEVRNNADNSFRSYGESVRCIAE